MFLANAPIISSINERSMHPSSKNATYSVVFFNDIKNNRELLNNSLEIVIFEAGDFTTLDQDLASYVISRAEIILTSDQRLPKDLYKLLGQINKKTKSVDVFQEKLIFIISKQSIEEVKSRKSNAKPAVKFESKED